MCGGAIDPPMQGDTNILYTCTYADKYVYEASQINIPADILCTYDYTYMYCLLYISLMGIRYPGKQGCCLQPEIDGLRVISDTTSEFLHRVTSEFAYTMLLLKLLHVHAKADYTVHNTGY